MRRSIRMLVLAGSAAVGVACNPGAAEPPSAPYYDAEVVERLAPDCLAAGHDAAVCGCAMRRLAEETRSPGFVLLEMAERVEPGWPGKEGGVLARVHASCEKWAVALGLLAPSVATGPQR